MFYMIEEMSFKCLLDIFWTVLPKDVFRNPIKSLWWSFFCKDIKQFLAVQLTIFEKNLHHRCFSGFLLSSG